MLRNLEWGIGWGIFVGLVLMLMAALVIGLGSGLPEDAPSTSYLLAVYPTSGAVSGFVLGLLRPWIVTKVRALIVAPVLLLPPVLGFTLLSGGPPGAWDGPTWFGVIASAVVLGLIAGHHGWKASRPFGGSA